MKKASTVIFAARSRSFQSEFRILMIKRAAKSRFMPGLYVFPGGVEEESDSSQYWHSKFPQATQLGSRIAGLREAFEETHLLLTVCVLLDQDPPVTVSSDWPKKVNQDPQVSPC